MGNWSTPIIDGDAARRAGGRRRHNAKRKREMWKRRFAILQIYARLEDGAPHGLQQALAERFDVNKTTISRDVVWVEGSEFAYSGMSPLKCSFRRGEVSIEWTNPAPGWIVKNARRLLQAAKRDK